MSEITTIVGQRLRLRRQELGYSQELTSEKAGLHPTYIGQVERGEKNATLESIEKIVAALNVPLSKLFDKYDYSIVTEKTKSNLSLKKKYPKKIAEKKQGSEKSCIALFRMNM